MDSRTSSGARACNAKPTAGARPFKFSAPPRPTPVSLALMAAMGVLPGGAIAYEIPDTTEIVKDGRTATTVDVNGNTIDINTGTRRGNRAFNSFHDFVLAQGDTVNLHLPSDTRHLINLVHDSRAIIDGDLYSFMQGQVGGNVVFADPHGVVIGPNGVVNVGSLLLTTPTQAFMDQMLDAEGNINDGLVSDLLKGEVPLSDDGAITIDGRVNASHSVRLRAAAISVGAAQGQIDVTVDQDHLALFDATVNTDDLDIADAVVLDDGVIEIVASNSATGQNGVANAEATVTVGGALSADNILLAARAEAVATFDGTINTLIDGTRDALELIGYDQLPDVDFALAIANATATVDVASTASLTATEDLDISASATRGATAAADASGSYGGVSAAFGRLAGDTSATLAEGAVVDVGGALDVAASSDNTLDISAATVVDDTGIASVAGTVALGFVDVSTTASVLGPMGDGAVALKAGSLSVDANSTDSYSVTAEATGEADGGVGIAAAVLDVDTTTLALLGGTVDVDDDITVTADSDVSTAVTRARVGVGSAPADDTGDDTADDASDDWTSFLEGLVGDASEDSKDVEVTDVEDENTKESAPGSEAGGGFPLSFGAAIALTWLTDVTEALVLDNALDGEDNRTNAGADTHITAGGNVTVAARRELAGFANQAVSSAVANTENAGGVVGISAAVAFANIRTTVSARIGDDAAIEAARLGLLADYAMPTAVDWGDDGAPGSRADLAADGADLETWLSSWAGSETGGSGTVGVAGAVSVLMMDSGVEASVGERAMVTLTGDDEPWNTDLGGGDVLDWDAVADVRAVADLSAITLVGGGGSSDGVGLGGGVNWHSRRTSAKARVGDDAQLLKSGPGGGTGLGVGSVNLVAIRRDSLVTVADLKGESGGAVGLGVAVALALFDGESRAGIGEGAVVDVDGAVSVSAVGETEGVTLVTSSMSAGGEIGIAATVAYTGITGVTEGSLLAAKTDAGSVTVAAHNTNSYLTEAEASAKGGIGLGIAAAIAEVGMDALVRVGGTIESAGDVLAFGISETTGSKVKAGTSVAEADAGDEGETDDGNVTGEGEEPVEVSDSEPAGGTTDFVAKRQKNKADDVEEKSAQGEDPTPGDGEQSAGTNLKFAAALGLAVVEQSADVRVEDDTSITTSAGDVVLAGYLRDGGVQTHATAGAESTVKDGATGIAVSAAVALGFHHNSAAAIVGEGVTISGGRIGIGADVAMPMSSDLSWGQFLDIEDIYAEFKDNDETPLLDKLKAAMRGYASATVNVQGEGFGFGGSVNYAQLDNDATAWVGAGSTLTATDTVAADGWSTDLNDDISLDWDAAADVTARGETRSLEVAGNINSLFDLSASSAEGGVLVGGAFNWVDRDGKVRAGLGADVTVDADSLRVSADRLDQVVAITPGSGGGASITGVGMVTVTRIGGETHASISNTADITADSLAVRANQDLSVWSLSGALARGENVGVGIAVAVNDLQAGTRAWIGDNSDEAVEGETTAGTAGSITTADLNVRARTGGVVGSGAVAGAEAAKSSEAEKTGLNEQTTERTDERTADADSETVAVQDQAAGDEGNLNKSQDQIDGGSEGPPSDGNDGGKNQKGGAKVAVAGAATVTLGDLSTTAEINDATIHLIDGADGVDINVLGITDADMIAVAGAGALVRAGSGGGSGTAIAGVLALNHLRNTTHAGLVDTTITDAGDVAVEALTAGDLIAVGLGMAVTAGTDQGTSIALAGSVGYVGNTTRARISGGSIDMDGDLLVTAYDRTRMANGGGAIAVSSKTSVGAALSLGLVSNTLSAEIDGTRVDGADSVIVQALSGTQVLGGAGSVSVSTSSSGLAFNGSAVFHKVDNEITATIRGGAEIGTTDEVGSVSVTAAGTTGVDRLDDLVAGREADSEVDFDLDDSELMNPSDEPPAAESGTTGEGNDPGEDYETEDTDIAAPDIQGETVVGIAGTISASSQAAAGVSFVGNFIDSTYTASIVDAGINAAGNVHVKAADSAVVVGLAVGASGSGKFALTGSATVNEIGSSALASIGDEAEQRTVITADSVDVVALKEADVYALAGSVAFSGKAGIGISIGYNGIGTTTHAGVANADLTVTGGDVAVDAASTSSIYSAAISGAGAGTVAIAGSVNINAMSQTVHATVDDADITSDTLRVEAGDASGGDSARIWSLSGDIKGGGTVAVGASVAVNLIGNDYLAEVRDSELTVDSSVDVLATTTGEIWTFGVSGGAAGTVAVGAGAATGSFESDVTARMYDTGLEGGTADVLVGASDNSSIRTFAASLQGGGSVGIAGALTVNTMDNDIIAEIDGGGADRRIHGRNVMVTALSDTDIGTVAVGASAAGNVALSGSVTVSTVKSRVHSRITGGADVLADNNVGVFARSKDLISVVAGAVSFAGPGLGGAGAVTVNQMEGLTEAAITGSDTVVVALAEDATDFMDVGTGNLANPPSGNPFASIFGGAESDEGAAEEAPEAEDFAVYDTPTLTPETRQVTGVAVDALSLQQADAGVATGALNVDFVGGGTALAGTINTTVMAGETRAVIDGATVGRQADRRPNDDVNVVAGHHSYGTSVVLGIAAGSVGGTAAVTTDVFDGKAEAIVNNASVHTGGDLNVDAVSTRNLLGVAAGLAVGTYAGATATGGVTFFEGETTAEITGDTRVEAGNVRVSALSDSIQQLISVGFSASLGGAGTGGFAIAASENVTTARIADTIGGDNGVFADGNVIVDADNTTAIDSVVAAAAAGGVAVVGAVSTLIVANDTLATVDNARVDADGNLDVTATDTLDMGARAGGAAFSVGGSAALGVTIASVKSNTEASILNSDVDALDVSVQARRNGKVDLETYLASVAFSGVAISGAVSVLLFGDELNNDLGDDTDGDLNNDLQGDGNWVGKSDDFASTDHLTGEGEGGEQADRSNGLVDGDDDVRSRSTFSVHDSIYGDAVDSTSATIGGGTVDARHVTVSATDETATSNLALSAAAGLVGFGGSVAVTQVNSNVGAQVTPVTMHASSLTVDSLARDAAGGKAVEVDAIAGGAGLVGVGAAVAVGQYNANVATLLGGTITLGGNLNATATESATVEISGLGAALGALAVGVVVSLSDRESEVATTFQSDADISGANLDATATANGHSNVEGQVAAGGLLGSGVGAGIDALDKTKVTLQVDGGAKLKAGNNLNLTTLAMPRLSASALTASVAGGISIGANVVLAEARTDNRVNVDGNALLEGTNVTLLARSDRGAWDTVSAEALGVSGGLLAGINSTEADARNLTETRALVGSNVIINATGAVSVTARGRTSQYAEADGYAFGALAVGANVATAQAGGITIARLDGSLGYETDEDGLVTVQAASVAVQAISETRNRASSTAGSGGIIAGAASTARTGDNSTTEAHLQGGGHGKELWAGEVGVTAFHTSDFNAGVDSTQASLVGMSGAWADNQVNANVLARVGGDADISAGKFDMKARSSAVKPEISGQNVNSGSGGAFNGAAASSKSDISFNTRAEVAAGADVKVVGDWRDPENLTVLAENIYQLWDRVKLDAGGAIAIARGESELRVSSAIAAVTIGAGANLASVGDIILATYTDATISANTDVKTYGAAGAAQGVSRVDMNAQHTVTVGDSATMEALGFLRLHAGRNLSDRRSLFDLNTRTDLWNKTAFPVETDPDAFSNVSQTNTITVGNGADLGAVKDVHLYTAEGQLRLYARGVGKDLYRAAAESVVNGVGSLVGAGEVSLDITAGETSSAANLTVAVNGDVRSGIRSNQLLHIKELDTEELLDDSGNVVLDEFGNPVIVPFVSDDEKSEGVSYRVVDSSLSDTIQARLETLYTYLSNYKGGETEEAAFRAEINILEMQLEELAKEAGYEEDDYTFYVEGERRINLPREFPIVLVEVDPIIARPGNVKITAQALVGAGTLDAPGDATIDILNETPAFLQVSDLLIPNDEGGQITLNGGLVNSVADINARNRVGAVATFSEVNTAENSPSPAITVSNTWNPATWVSQGSADRPLNPDIFIQGDITNLRGSVTVEAAYGSVYAEGDIRANTVALSAGRDFILAYRDGFRHIGGDPRSSAPPETDPFVIVGNNIVASARYLNINGLMRSGIPDWAVVIDSSVLDAIAAARVKYENGETSGPIVGIRSATPSTGTIGFSYDFTPGDEALVLDMVDVRGGYMELTGKIMNTGGGKLEVVDGYGRVAVDNQTGEDLRIVGIDVGNDIEGTLRLNDTGRYGNEDDGELWSTIYTRVGDSIQTYVGRYKDIRRNGDYLVGNVDGTTARTTHYETRSGLDYVWLTGETSEITIVETYYSDTAIGFIPSGSGNLYSRSETSGDVQPIDDAEYVWRNLMLSRADRDGEPSDTVRTWSDSYTIDADSVEVDYHNWTTCETRVIVCVETRQWQKVTTTYGAKEIFRNGVQADYDIPIEFIGFDTGTIDVDSAGRVILAGSVLNPTGDVSISGKSINQASESAITVADNLSLEAVQGIGADNALRIQATGAVDAVTASGDINLYGVQGDINVGVIDTGTGNVTLDTQNAILGTGAGHRISGNQISLSARQGGIGGAAMNALVNIDSGAGDAGLFNAEAQQGVHVRELSGDLRINQINANASNVTVVVDDGDIVDANTEEQRDERAIGDLRNLWADMGLTGDDANDALDRELEAQANAGTAAYKHYWRLRGLDVDSEGNFVADDYDPATQAQLADFEKDYYRDVNGWTEQQITDFEANRLQELEDLHARFGGLGDYDDNFSYTLSQAEIDDISAGYQWTEDQLRFSISQGLFNRTTNTSTSIEAPNIIGANVTLVANKVGRTLDEDMVIDLSGGLRSLTEDELIALSTAEFDDISFDDDDLEIIRIRRIEDVDLDITGHASVLAQEDIFLGSTDNIRLFNVQGDAVRIGTNGAIETGNPGDTVLWGNRVILEASQEYVGTAAAPLMTDIDGELTVRTDGALHLINQGNLMLDRIRALDSANLTVNGGSLIAAREFGETIASAIVNLDVGGDIGAADQRVNMELTSGSGLVSILAGGNVWLGAEQGPFLVDGDLRLGDSTIDGDYDIADVRDVTYHGEIRVEGDAGVDARTIRTIDDAALDVVGNATLNAQLDIGESADPMRVAVGTIDASSDQGNIYLHFLRDVNGGSVSTLSGEQIIDGDADVSLDNVVARDRILVDDLDGRFSAINMTSGDSSIDVFAESAAIEFGTAATELRVITTGEQSHGQLDPDADGTLKAANLVQLHGGDDVRFRNVLAGDESDIPAEGGDADLQSDRGSIYGNYVFASRDIRAFALNGGLYLTRLDYGNEYVLQAGRDIAIGLGKTFDSSTGSIFAGRNIEIAVAGVEGDPGDILLGGIEARDGHIILDASGSIRVAVSTPPPGEAGVPTSGSMRAGTYVDMIAGGDIDVENTISSDGSQNLTAGGAITAGRLQSGGTITGSAGAGIDLGLVSAAADVDLRALDDIVALVLDAGGNQVLSADGLIRFDRLYAGGDVEAVAGGDLSGDLAEVIGHADFSAGMDNGVPVGPATLDLGRLHADTARLIASERIQVDNAFIGTRLELWSRIIGADITHEPAGGLEPLRMLVAGPGSGHADSAILSIDATNGVVFDLMHSRYADIRTTAEDVEMVDGYTELMELRTATSRVWMNNTDPTAVDWEAQLYQPGFAFIHDQQGTLIYTDAYVVRFAPDHEVRVPNFSPNHTPGGPDVDGRAADRDAQRALRHSANTLSNGVFVPLGTSQPPDDPTGPDDEGEDDAVNLSALREQSLANLTVSASGTDRRTGNR